MKLTTEQVLNRSYSKKFKPTKLQAIRSLLESGISGAEDGTDIDYRGQTPPTESEINARYKEISDGWDAQQYQRDRNYSSVGEQLDMIYWDRKNGTKKWEEAIDKVKADHPKG